MTIRSGQKKNFDNYTDEELVRDYRKQKNPELIGILFKRYSHLVFGVCLHYFYDKDKAADAVMNIYEKLFDALARHKVTNFKAWICAVSKNHCLMHLRKSANKRMVLVDDFKQFDHQSMENELPLHLNIAELDDKIETLLESISALKPLQQLCIRLFYLESLSYEEVAGHTGLSAGEVKSHIQNGKRNLKIYLEGKKKFRYE
jgi:RNA polymerase sigma-70 factor, ECF subfamily